MAKTKKLTLFLPGGAVRELTGVAIWEIFRERVEFAYPDGRKAEFCGCWLVED